MRYSRKIRNTLLVITLTLSIFVSMSMTPAVFSGGTAEEMGKTTLFSFKSSSRIPSNPDDFRIVFHTFHEPVIDEEQISNLQNLINKTYQLHFIDRQLRENDLDSNDVLVILGPTQDYEDDEVSIIHRFVNNGGSLLVTGDEDNDVKEVLDVILKPFGIIFGNITVSTGDNTTIPEPYTLVRDFSTPRIPVVENITQIIYQGVNLTLNDTYEYQWNTSLSPLLKERYSLMFAVGDTSEGYNPNILSAIVELNEGRSRIMAVGSTNMWNDSFVQNRTAYEGQEPVNIPGTSVNLTFADNTLFAENTFKWLSSTTGHFKFDNESIEAPIIEQEIKFADEDGTYATLEIGQIISGAVTLQDWRNTSISSTNITFCVERTGRILRSARMSADENGTYNGYLNTTGLAKGWIDATFVATRRGYVDAWLEAKDGRIWLIPESKVAIPIDYAMLALLGAAVIIFVISIVLVLKLLPGELAKEP